MIKRIKQTTVISAGLVAFLIFAPMTSAQNTSKPAEPPNPLIPLKVDVVFNEYEGAKKVSSLPYTLSVNSNAIGRSQRTSLRVGLRVPVQQGLSYDYQDLGTEIDCSAESSGEGRFRVSLSLRRSSSYSPLGVRYHGGLYEFPQNEAAHDKTSKPAPESQRVAISSQPIITSFSTGLNLLMHDGQTIQGVMATDPVSGRVLKVDVTLHVVKPE